MNSYIRFWAISFLCGVLGPLELKSANEIEKLNPAVSVYSSELLYLVYDENNLGIDRLMSKLHSISPCLLKLSVQEAKNVLGKDLFEFIKDANVKKTEDVIDHVSMFKRSLDVYSICDKFIDTALPFAVSLLCQKSSDDSSYEMYRLQEIIISLVASGIDINSAIILPGDFYILTSLDILLRRDLALLSSEFKARHFSLVDYFIERGACCSLKSVHDLRPNEGICQKINSKIEKPNDFFVREELVTVLGSKDKRGSSPVA